VCIVVGVQEAAAAFVPVPPPGPVAAVPPPLLAAQPAINRAVAAMERWVSGRVTAAKSSDRVEK
jgi:hypothetical protein